MLGWVKKIFGTAAQPASPASPPPQISVQTLTAAKLVPPKTIWHLIRDNDLAGLQELIEKDPAQLGNTSQMAIRKRINVKMTPAHYAAYLGQAASLILLHQNGADINAVTPNDYNCLHLAARCKTGGVATAYLLEKSTLDIDALSGNGTTALMEAARSGNETGAKELLKKNPKTDISNAQSPAAMALAARNGHFGIVTALAEQGADINAADTLLRTPLWQAVLERREDIADYLLGKGAVTNTADLQGQTLLMVASQRANIKLMTALLDAGHDPTERDNNGNTALHYACYDETADNAKNAAALLLKRGAWIDVQNKLGECPLAYARAKGRSMASLVACLEAAQNDPAVARTPSLNDVFQQGAKREVRVMKALTLRAPAR